VLRAHRDALAAGLHHDHVAAGLVFFFRVAGPLLVEVPGPGSEVLGQSGQLGAADGDAGAGLDHLLGLPEPARGQVEGRQRPHPQGVRVAGQDLPRVGRVHVRLAAAAVSLPGGPDRPEHAGHAPPVPGLDDAVPDPGSAGDPLSALLARGIDVECGLRQPPLQLAAPGPDRLLPLPVVEVAGLVRGPGRQPGELLRRAGQQPVQPAQSNGRRALLTGAAIGIFITGVPSALVAASGGGVLAKDEAQVLFIVGILWAIAVGIAAFAYPVSRYRRKEHGLRQAGGRDPRTTV
jgi:hypothetical protein